MLSARTLLEKADLALSDLTSDGGLLQPQQANRFIKLLIKKSVLLPRIQTMTMNSPKRLIETLRFAGRVLKPGTEATALASAQRSKPDLIKNELDAKLYKAEVRLNNEVLEDNIERGALRNTIMQTLAEAVARDLEYAAWNGDTASADALLAVQDGFRKLITTNVTAFGGNPTGKALWLAMLKDLPNEFLLRNRLMFFTSINSELDWRDQLSERATMLGDNQMTGSELARFQNMPILAIPEAPENLGAGTNETETVLSDPQNLVAGFVRRMRIETDRDITAGELIIVVSMRVAFQMVHEPAAVKFTGVTTD
jgi:HK97 family phage major capsid protein